MANKKIKKTAPQSRIKIRLKAVQFFVRYSPMGLFSSDNRYGALVECAFDAEFNLTIHQGVQGVIFTHANVIAGVEFCPALTNNDGTGLDGLTTVNFDA